MATTASPALAAGLMTCALAFPGLAAAAAIAGTGDITRDPALAGARIQTFDNVRLDSYNPLLVGGVAFRADEGFLTVGNYPDYVGRYNNRGTRYLSNYRVANEIRFDFSAPVHAFAFNFGASDNDWVLRAYGLSGTLLDSQRIHPVLTSNAGDYFGLRGGGISYATLSNTGLHERDFVFIDNFAYVGAVPEPASYGLMLAGLSVIGVLAKRRRRAR